MLRHGTQTWQRIRTSQATAALRPRSGVDRKLGCRARSVNMLQKICVEPANISNDGCYLFSFVPSLRWGNTQYNEVPTEYASLLVENYTNDLSYLGNQGDEFMKWSLDGHPKEMMI